MGLKLGASAGLVAMIAYFVPLPSILAELTGVEWRWVAVGLTVALMTNCLAAAQMQRVLDAQEHRLSWIGILAVNFITKFYGLFLPSYLSGGAIRWYHFSRPDGRRAESFAAIVFNRQLEIAVLLSLGLLFLGQAQLSVQPVGLGTVLICLAPIPMVAHHAILVRPVQEFVRCIVVRFELPVAISSKVLKVLDAYALYGRRDRGFHFFVSSLCLLRQLVGVVTLWIFALAVDIDISLVDLGWVRSALDIALMFPLSLGGLGIREGSLVVLLGSIGIPAAAAVTLGLLLLLRTLIFALLGGLVELWRINSEKGLFARCGRGTQA